jgi:hypothetical protein
MMGRRCFVSGVICRGEEAKTTTTANTGILRFAQDDDVKQNTLRRRRDEHCAAL